MLRHSKVADLGPVWDSFVNDVPHLCEYFGVWCVETKLFQQLVGRFEIGELKAHAVRAEGAEISQEYPAVNGTAVFNIVGPMMKFESSLGGASTVALRRQLRAAKSDDGIERGMLRIDSPGGTVSGMQEFVEDLRSFADEKPLHAHIEDSGNSAAYWAASQAERITASPMSLVGSIGTYAVLRDTSKAAEQLGVKVEVIKAGEFKGLGVEGTPVTDAVRAEVQKIVDGFNEFFIKAVSVGRSMETSAVRQVADGRTHFAEKALEMGLIDAVESFDTAMNSFGGIRVQAFVPGTL